MTSTTRRETSTFRYAGFDIDRDNSVLTCTYEVGGLTFTERVQIEGADWSSGGAEGAARLVFLLAGVSYYKAFATAVVDLGDFGESVSCEFVQDFFVQGLGEYAFRNGLDLSEVAFRGSGAPGLPIANASRHATRPLIPFGGGMDSIVSVEIVRASTEDVELFVVSREDDNFEAIEQAAAVTRLPIRRVSRTIDPKLLESRKHGWLNGHVPVTGILSAIAVLTAVTTGRDAVVMSNEWSASSGNLEHRGHIVNHQYSKSMQFEQAFIAELARGLQEPPAYFSLLRPFSELWVAQRFSAMHQYHSVFRSCNRSFHIDPSQRSDQWCAQCDKCAFIDLILSPFLSSTELSFVFGGNEPLANRALLRQFRALIGTSSDMKPFECVGDISESRAAVALAVRREDRRDSAILHQLATEIDCDAEDTSRLLRPMGAHFIPDPYASTLGLE